MLVLLIQFHTVDRRLLSINYSCPERSLVQRKRVKYQAKYSRTLLDLCDIDPIKKDDIIFYKDEWIYFKRS